jgi:hypothetical protein
MTDNPPGCSNCEIIERIRASFDAETRAYFVLQADPLTHILDNEGAEALVEAVLAAAEDDSSGPPGV